MLVYSLARCGPPQPHAHITGDEELDRRAARHGPVGALRQRCSPDNHGHPPCMLCRPSAFEELICRERDFEHLRDRSGCDTPDARPRPTGLRTPVRLVPGGAGAAGGPAGGGSAAATGPLRAALGGAQEHLMQRIVHAQGERPGPYMM